MSSLSKLTIVIFTCNRPRYVLRNMGLWSGSGATVLVLDGSAEAISTEQLGNFASNIHYHHHPVSIWARMAAGAALVNTEYVSFLADDEFFIPSAVEACIFELENNQDLVACCGRGISKILAADLTVHWSEITSSQSNYRGSGSGAVDQDDPVERMVSHMNPYNPSYFYAVCRSQEWRKAVLLFSGRQFSTGLTAELQFELSMCFHGKVKVIDELMWLRSAENPSSAAGFELAFHAWFLDPCYVQEVDDFLNATAHDLAATSELNFDAIRCGLERACSAYVAYCEKDYQCKQSAPSVPGSKRNSSSVVSPALKSYVRKFISGLPAPLLVVLPGRLRFRPYIDIAKGLESAGLHVDWHQLNTILAAVQKFHGNKS